MATLSPVAGIALLPAILSPPATAPAVVASAWFCLSFSYGVRPSGVSYASLPVGERSKQREWKQPASILFVYE
jgi:hypothetical protein